jgi:putative acetyltransferase
MEIRLGGLDVPDVIRLLEEHLQSMALHSPPESIHALDLAGLQRPEMTFWSVWQEGDLLGCGALKELDARHGEIRSIDD